MHLLDARVTNRKFFVSGGTVAPFELLASVIVSNNIASRLDVRLQLSRCICRSVLIYSNFPRCLRCRKWVVQADVHVLYLKDKCTWWIYEERSNTKRKKKGCDVNHPSGSFLIPCWMEFLVRCRVAKEWLRYTCLQELWVCNTNKSNSTAHVVLQNYPFCIRGCRQLMCAKIFRFWRKSARSFFACSFEFWFLKFVPSHSSFPKDIFWFIPTQSCNAVL